MKYSGIGRRKSAVAQVIFSETTNNEFQIQENILINNQKILDYFQNDPNVLYSLQQVFKIFGFNRPFKMRITVFGGGTTGQKEAICSAMARALSQNGWILSPLQKKPNLLTQDTRKKERKKYGLKKARKAPQYSKR